MTTPTEKKFINYWSEKRKLGKYKFSLLYGVLYFAMPAFIFSELVKSLFPSGNYEHSVSRFIIGIIIWSLLGFYLFGFLQWRGQEKRFLELQKKEDQ
jgi:predicted permease